MGDLSIYLGEPRSLDLEQYSFSQFSTLDELLPYLQDNHVDCLLLQASLDLPELLKHLQQQSILLPVVVLDDLQTAESVSYHEAILRLPLAHLNQLSLTIEQAITKFIQLQPDKALSIDASLIPQDSPAQRLISEQLRLAKKLKERLDYLGVYYKRNPQNFLRHMAPSEREELLRQLKSDYRDIILAYFSDEVQLNEKIDNFVNIAFFADVPVSQIVELHMTLMDEFSKQLKLEGRSDEILLDYRLTLIDTLAHLCEMYRRSIPREA